jgi:hypothetical protein
VYSGYYAQLARALLDAGDKPASVARFLCAEYRLKAPEAKEAIARGRLLEIKQTEEQASPIPRHGYRDTLRPRASSR